MLIVDASVVASWLFPDEINPYCEAILDRVGTEGALVPGIWPLQVANMITIGERCHRITPAQRVSTLQLLADLGIEVAEGRRIDALGALIARAQQHALSAYDACYLELALQEGLPLATQDGHRCTAAERTGVSLA